MHSCIYYSKYTKIILWAELFYVNGETQTLLSVLFKTWFFQSELLKISVARKDPLKSHLVYPLTLKKIYSLKTKRLKKKRFQMGDFMTNSAQEVLKP